MPEPWDIDRVYEILVQELCRRVPPEIEETLRVAAIAEWFDGGLLAELLGTDERIDERLAFLAQYSFVRVDDQGRVRFSPSVRTPLLDTWADKPTAYQKLNRRAASYFDRQAEKITDDPRVHGEYASQAVGHWLACDERTARQRLATLFEQNEAHYLLASCQLALERVEAVAGVSDQTQLWLRYWWGRLDLARDKYAASAARFQAVLEAADPSTALHALAGWSRGRAAAEQGDWSQAIEQYEDSLRTAQGLDERALAGRIMLALGNVHLEQARALGGLIRPRLARRKGWRGIVKAIPAFLIALPFVIYAWLIRHWRFLPPLHHSINYQNWTLARLLMTAVKWYQDAQHTFTELGDQAHLADTNQQLAQAYYRLGWWRAAKALFDQVLSSKPIITNAYRQAELYRDIAEMELGADNVDKAIRDLEKSLDGFKRYRDDRGKSQVRALLGQAWLWKGEFDRGLASFQESLQGFSALSDRLGIGQALHALRRWMQRTEPPPGQAAAVEKLIASTPLKTYLPRVPDRMVTILETLMAVGLIGLCAAEILTQAQIGLTPASELFRDLLLVRILLRLLGRIILLAWAFATISSLVGLLLIVYGARQKLQPERLDRIVTSPQALIKYDYRGQEIKRVPWDDVQAMVSAERIVWRKPIPLLSGIRVYGSRDHIYVPATMLWYDALKDDIDAHLCEHKQQPLRRRLDLRVLRSPLGVCLAFAPIVLLMQRAVGWNVMGRSFPFGLVLILTPLLMFLGLALLVVGPYWWLALYPLWVRYQQAPHSHLPWLSGGLGISLIAIAYGTAYWQPFYPIRNMLNAIVFPLGFVWVAATALWIATARRWAQKPIARADHIYPQWVRIAAVVSLIATLAILSLFAWQEWIPYVWIYPGIAYYEHAPSMPALERELYRQAIAYCTRGLEINADLADGYYFRALAHRKLGEDQKTVRDLTYLIEGRGTKLPHYWYARALSLADLGDTQAACDDLKTALNARQWAMSQDTRSQARQAWQNWQCEKIVGEIE
jgi:tetratricopeptide (TPR) repeat protein